MICNRAIIYIIGVWFFSADWGRGGGIGSNFSKIASGTQTTPIYTLITTPLINITTPQPHSHQLSK